MLIYILSSKSYLVDISLIGPARLIAWCRSFRTVTHHPCSLRPDENLKKIDNNVNHSIYFFRPRNQSRHKPGWKGSRQECPRRQPWRKRIRRGALAAFWGCGRWRWMDKEELGKCKKHFRSQNNEMQCTWQIFKVLPKVDKKAWHFALAYRYSQRRWSCRSQHKRHGPSGSHSIYFPLDHPRRVAARVNLKASNPPSVAPLFRAEGIMKGPYTDQGTKRAAMPYKDDVAHDIIMNITTGEFQYYLSPFWMGFKLLCFVGGQNLVKLWKTVPYGGRYRVITVPKCWKITLKVDRFAWRVAQGVNWVQGH